MASAGKKMATTTLIKDSQSAWLLDARRSALDAFRQADVPAKTVETWRRVDFNAWRLGALKDEHREALPVPAQKPIQKNPALIEEAGIFLQDGYGSPATVLAPELAAKGVLLMGLEDAAARHSRLVEPHLKDCIAAAHHCLGAATHSGAH